MTDRKTHFQDLPFDILAVIFQHLDVKSFLSLCSTCSDLYEHSTDLDVWRRWTLADFRLPNRPSAQYDGRRWMSLYKRLKKEASIFLWGQHSDTRLILSDEVGHQNIFRYPTYAWPQRPGVIADMQIGGWSTTVLDSNGRLYSSGVMNGMRPGKVGSPTFRALKFPVGSEEDATEAVVREEAGGHLFKPVDESSKTITSFSAGRTHVIALAEDGACWLWLSIEKPALKLIFPDVGGDSAVVERVCAGFSQCSVYIRHWGIIIIDLESRYREFNAFTSGYSEIPSSSDWTMMVREPSNDANHGKMVKHILLEEFILWVTDKGKLFAAYLNNPLVFDIPGLSNVVDIQGSFRNFAIFKDNGTIDVLPQLFLFQRYSSANDPRSGSEEITIDAFTTIPSLQNTGVVQLAFGDYHFLALHSDGQITSYGKESHSSGALGLCGIKSRFGAQVRGVHAGLMDNTLLPYGFFTGRHIWFNTAKHRWLNTINSAYRAHPFADEAYLGEFSEWVEQRGSDWDDIPEAEEKNSDGLGSHFALSVAAGGWSSGALVLVNEEMDEAITTHCPPPQLEKLPNVEFSDGSWSAPGEQKFKWKKQPPRFTVIKDESSTLWGVNGWKWHDDDGAPSSHDEQVEDLGVD